MAPLSYFRKNMTGNIHGRLNRCLDGTIKLGDSVKSNIDEAKRKKTEVNHSCVHLLQYAHSTTNITLKSTSRPLVAIQTS